ncbi:MAG: hypothetical protein RIR17_2474 [Planctomycetota bacterium]
MKLLFDQNISPRLPKLLNDLFPGSSHVLDLNLAMATDSEIWNYALSNNYIIVTKDDDFNNLSVLLGSPPKVILLAVGNCSTDEIHQTIRKNHSSIDEFTLNETMGTLLLV